MSKKTFGSASGKAKSEELRRKCVEYLAHYSLSKAHKGCTVVYDKDTATIKVCENEVDTEAECDRTEIRFSGTGLNDWYRALNRAGYRTFMGGHELVLTVTKGGKEEEVWYYLTPPLQHASSSSTLSVSDTLQQTATGTITFLGDNTMCNFNIVVNYGSSTE